MKNYKWAREHEEAYLEERKSRCEHCYPEHEETIKWLDNVANQELVRTLYRQYGINPDTIYKEFEAEIELQTEERMIPEPIEHVA